ncbi:unnamed protein product [Nippostrongylus brasiliensis]|uniref:PMEI domain-containing protein n=1 Tax=Nippostrongylus brasiliensis TaxID=27835 RepID=A0A0N4YE64_NIPBR|nr:unnamed protein product [Nippostrongylus brasiliensis]
MVTATALVPLAVLLAWEAAVIKDLRCAFKTEMPGFCGLIRKAHKVNVKTMLNLNGTLLEGVRKNLIEADDALIAVLRKKNKSELLAPLGKALESENHALSELKVSCKEHETDSGCRPGSRGLTRSTLTLIKAIKMVVDENQNKTIIAAEDEFTKAGENKTELIQGFASKVLEAIKSKNATSK